MPITTQFVGRLTQDPELRTLPSGDPVANFRLAVDGLGQKNATGFIDVVSFGAGGKAAAEQLGKGRLVEVIGRLSHREWQTDQGAKRHAYEIVGALNFLDYAREEQAPANEPEAEEPKPAPKGAPRSRATAPA